MARPDLTARVVDGKALANTLQAEVAVRVARLAARRITPGLVVVLAGDDPASAVYVRNKARAAEACGLRSRVVRLPAEASVDALLDAVHTANADPQVHGVLVQLPLPSHLSPEHVRRVTRAIAPEKDVDGFLPVSQGLLALGEPGFVPCTPAGCMRILAHAQVPLRGRRAVVIGRSAIVGKPMAHLLLAADATVTIAHSHTEDLPGVVREADVVVAAVGRPGLVRGDWLKPGAAVLDVGINRLPDGRLVGDVDFESAARVAGVITPVPGGVGPMTIACLLDNTVRAAERELS